MKTQFIMATVLSVSVMAATAGIPTVYSEKPQFTTDDVATALQSGYITATCDAIAELESRGMDYSFLQTKDENGLVNPSRKTCELAAANAMHIIDSVSRK
jgi:hypothetical protein